jgi:acyl carrier protein
LDPKIATDRIIEVVKNFEKVKYYIVLMCIAILIINYNRYLINYEYEITVFSKVDAIKVSPIARFKEDLDLDSLDAVEVVMAIEEEFGIEIPDSEADKILSISDAVAYISSHPMAK